MDHDEELGASRLMVVPDSRYYERCRFLGLHTAHIIDSDQCFVNKLQILIFGSMRGHTSICWHLGLFGSCGRAASSRWAGDLCIIICCQTQSSSCSTNKTYYYLTAQLKQIWQPAINHIGGNLLSYSDQSSPAAAVIQLPACPDSHMLGGFVFEQRELQVKDPDLYVSAS